MKENILEKIYNHIDREDIISQLTLGTPPAKVSDWLKDKYAAVDDQRLIISAKSLKQFKDEYLNLYMQMSKDFSIVKQERNGSIITDMQSAVKNNSAYKAKLNDYLDKEINIKDIVKNMVLAIESRAEEVFNNIRDNPSSIKMDYVLIQWFNALTAILEKYDAILNGSPDKITQQNNINIQILDQHVSIFQNAIRGVIARLNQDEALKFVSLLNEEMNKIKPPSAFEPLSVEQRLYETKQLAANQLDIPSF